MNDQASGSLRAKPKRRIRARDVIRDVREGRSAWEIMNKYRITATGLRRLLRQLIDAKIMSKTELDGHEGLYAVGLAARSLRTARRMRLLSSLEVYDGREPIKAGRIVDISANGVRVEGIEMVLGAVTEFVVRVRNMNVPPIVFEGTCRWVAPPREPGDKWVTGIEIMHISNPDSQELRKLLHRVHALKAGGLRFGPRSKVPNIGISGQVHQGYRREPPPNRVLRTDLRTARPKKRIGTDQFLEDFRAGMPDGQLMAKYGVSSEGLQKIFRKLVEADLITPKELRRRTLSDDDSLKLDLDALMSAPQEPLSCLIPVHDMENPAIWGSVCEIGANALTVRGIQVAAGQVKTLVVVCAEFLPVASFSLAATCRWCRKEGPEQTPVAGFEFDLVTEDARPNLNELLRFVKIQDE